ncbi:MAG: starch-binding protein [Dysgonamonadaceae bacterium]|nr:starch-binding protein [Dysgonamonadaceae bacterium]
MKKIQSILSIACLALLVFACEEDYKRSAGGDVTVTVPALIAPPSVRNELVASENEQGYLLFRIYWNEPRFTYASGVPAEATDIHYAMEMDRVGNEFAYPKSLFTTDKLYSDVYSEQMNHWVQELFNCDAVIWRLIEWRVKMVYSLNGVEQTPVYSNALPLEMRPHPYADPKAPITLRWKYVGDDWTEIAIYAWGASPDAETFGGWPGQLVEPDANGWYSVTVPAGQTFGNVILNNNGGGQQFDVSITIIADTDLEITSGSFTVLDCQ